MFEFPLRNMFHLFLGSFDYSLLLFEFLLYLTCNTFFMDLTENNIRSLSNYSTLLSWRRSMLMMMSIDKILMVMGLLHNR